MKFIKSKVLINILVTILIILCLVNISTILDSNDKYIPLFVGILVSLTSVIGVWITNFYNHKNNMNRQDFDNNQKEQERIHNMRKEIYLNASDRIIELSSMIGSLVDPISKINEAEKKFTDFLITMNRLRLISNTDTSEKSSKVVRSFSKLYMDVYYEAYEIIVKDDGIKLNQEFLEKQTKDIDRVLDLMRLNFEADDVDLEKFKKLESSMEFFLTQRNQYQKNIDELYKIKLNLSEKLAQKIAEMMPSIQSEIVDLTVLMRKDIFGENGLNKFHEDLKSEIEDSHHFFEDVIDKIKN